MWHQWLNFGFATLREYFFLGKENKKQHNLLGLWWWPWHGGRLPPGLCIATGGSARDVTHSITSIIQSIRSQTPGWSGVYWWGFLQTRPRWMEDANKRCGNIRRDSSSTESACSRRGVNAPACLVEEQWTVSKPDAVSQHNKLSLSTGHFNVVSVCHK